MLKPSIWVPVKVLPGKEALEYFVDRWKQEGGVPFNGECELPETEDPGRLMTIDVSRISHCIEDIDMSTYDEKKSTVMMKCRTCGPKGDEVLDNYIKKDVRFTTRIVHGIDEKTKEPVARIVTFDAVTRPDKENWDRVKRNVKDADMAKKDLALFERKRLAKK